MVLAVMILAAAALVAAEPVLAAEAKPGPAALAEQPPATRTGKERLGRKWSDDQRLDNCKVPHEQRGTKPRPETCPSEATQ